MAKIFDLDEQYNRERIIKDVSMVETEFIKQGYEIEKLKTRIQELETAGREYFENTKGLADFAHINYKNFAALLNNPPLEKE